jgi:hypothetical protein
MCAHVPCKLVNAIKLEVLELCVCVHVCGSSGN